MHIGFLTSEYPNYGITCGGIGTSVHALVHALRDHGMRISVFLYGQSRDDISLEDGIQIVSIKNRVLKGLSWWLTRKKIEKIINRAVDKEGLDLVEAPDWTGITAFMRLKCPIILKLHGSDTYFCHLEQRSVKYWNRLQERRAYLSADAIIAASYFTGKVTNQIFAVHRDFHVVHNGIDVNRFNGDAYLNRSTAAPIILYFGTLIRKKGVLDLPFIFNHVHTVLPDATLVLAGADAPDAISGSPSTWAMMQASFTEGALQQVTYNGKFPYSAIRALIQTADICVFPSYAEACPVSWLEAMAMGKAVVASSIGWAPELIEHGVDGYLVYPNRHAEFAEKICFLLMHSVERQSMGIRARQKSLECFDQQRIAQLNLAIYRTLLPK